MEAAQQAVIDAIKALRVYGQTAFRTKVLEQDEQQMLAASAAQKTDLDYINGFVAAMGWKPLGYDWTILNKAQAEHTLAALLHRSMAYSTEMAETATAEDYARRFISLYQEERTIFVSNGMFYLTSVDGIGPWNSLTSSTYDSGIIAFDRHSLSLLWFEEDD